MYFTFPYYGFYLLIATCIGFVDRFIKPIGNIIPQEWNLIGNYGLFAIMTPARYEISIEGSEDSENWQEYEFKWKAGDVKRAPQFVAPHMPRLDWQMWFAALGSFEGNLWVRNLMIRILQGKQEVLGLLKTNPFSSKPPKYVRAVLYQYHFTSSKNRARTGSWWWKETKGIYSAPISLPW